MKKLLLLCSVILGSAVGLTAQVTSITVETFYTDNGSVPNYPAGHTTYRIYANCTSATDVVSSVYGSSTNPLSLQVSGNIWNTQYGGSTSNDVSCAIYQFRPEVQYDSYVTISKSCDTDGAGQTRVAPTETATWLDPYFGISTAVPYGSGNFLINSSVGSSWFALPSQDPNSVAGSDLKVLLAQITTNGSVCGSFNLQVFPNYQASASNHPYQLQTDLAFGTVNCGTPGCTNPQALNYDANADYDNGLCLLPCQLSLTTLIATAPSCGNLSDGSIQFGATGNQDLVYYSFNNGTSAPSNTPTVTRSGLANGTYTIVAKDSRFDNPLFNPGGVHSCQIDTTITITTAPLVMGASTGTNVTCAGLNDGCINASATGGTGTLVYGVIANSNNDTIQNGLPTGSYCGLGAGVLTLIQGASLAATCSYSTNGQRVITWSGGTGDVDWSVANDGTYELPGNANNIVMTNAPGNYTIYARDAAGCTANLNYTIPGPAAIAITPTITLPNCVGSADGSFTVAATGGNGGFQYALGTGTPSSNNSFTGLAAGNYIVSATDNQGCIGTDTVTVANPTPVGGIVTAVNISCHDANDGSVTVVGNGGTAPYQYSIDNGTTWVTNGTFGGLSAGSYTLKVRDAHGCVWTQTTASQITNPAVLSATAAVQNISCHGLTDGSAVITATGGTAPYTYSNGGPAGSNATFGSLAGGNYTFTVVDARGCTATATGTVVNPDPIVITGLSNDNINSTPGGSTPYTVSGGTGNYSFSWTNAQGSQVSNTQVLGPFTDAANAGSYTLTVTDANGCTATQTIAITGIAELNKTVRVALNPNPNNGQFTLNIQGLAGEKLSYTITDTQGRMVVRKELGNANGNRTEAVNVSNIAGGVYYVKIQAGDAFTTVKMIKEN
jgi:Secretion system C-terminal sorting domain/SprB repeat